MKLMNLWKLQLKGNKKGFTLIEIILAIAILGILAVIFIPLFTSGYIMIIKNGHTSDTLFLKQDTLEQKTAEGAAEGSSDVLRVDFPGYPVEVEGQKITDGEFNLFIPNK